VEGVAKAGLVVIALFFAFFTPALVEVLVEITSAADMTFWGGLKTRAVIVGYTAAAVFLLLLLFGITASFLEGREKAVGVVSGLVLAFLAFGLAHTVGTLYRLGAEGLAMAGTAGAIAVAITAGLVWDP